MNLRARLRSVALGVATAMATSAASGAAGPDNPLSENPIFPTYRGSACFGDNCPPATPNFFYSTESLDCGKAGYGNPMPSISPMFRRLNDTTDPDTGEPVDSSPGAFDGVPYYDDFLRDLPDRGSGVSHRWEPVRSVLIRGTYSEIFRQPTIQELFGGDADSYGDQHDDATQSSSLRYDTPPISSTTRVNTFGERSRFIIDDENRWLYPHVLTKYRNLFRVETGTEAGSGSGIGVSTDANKRGLGLQPQFQYKFFPTTNFGIDVLPDAGMQYGETGAGLGPITGQLDLGAGGAYVPRGGVRWDDFERFASEAEARLFSSFSLSAPAVEYGSVNVETTGAPAIDFGPFETQQMTLGGTTYTSVTFPGQLRADVQGILVTITVTAMQVNGCRVILVPTDPNFQRTGRHGGGSWGQREDDQWAIKRVGFTDDDASAWNAVPDDASPVVVAVIDTGLDWHHADISPENIWRNEDEIPDNGIDDDRNGYVDDVIGWDFFGQHGRPWDFDGHGTVVAGIIAAAQNNGVGIAGINPHAKVMVLKGVNNFGNTRASFLAEAIVYAADNGAQVINLSVGGPHASRMEQAAIRYAHEKGVLIVAASGNDGIELDDFGPGGNDHVLTVGATFTDDRAAGFSNYGDRIDLVAPGVDVLSLRARYTDTNFRPANDEYVVGTNFVGDDKRYIHVSGTSFSAPIVTATASLLMAQRPELTAAEVEQILLDTAEDVEFPGKDKYTGHGMVDARAALGGDPGVRVVADITGVELVESESGEFIRVVGTIDATEMKRAWMQIGPGENPGAWRYVGQKRKYPINDGTLGTIPVREFSGSELWQVVINVEDRSGVVRRDAYPVRIN